jgi:hypothetical protein
MENLIVNWIHPAQGGLSTKGQCQNDASGKMELLRQSMTQGDFAQLEDFIILHWNHALNENFGCSLRVSAA